MAAPPIPPKGNSNSWMRGNGVTDQQIWKSENENLFTTNSQSGACFSDNFMSFFDSSLQAPPLPPRQANGKFQPLIPENNELSLVPPPPGTGQLYRSSADLHTFTRSHSTITTMNAQTKEHNNLFRNVSSSAVASAS
ncbi:hypothetical protein X975_19021, partial [Stegodyphus mimosarum]